MTTADHARGSIFAGSPVTLRPEQRRRHHRDTVCLAVGVRSHGDDDRVEQVIVDPVAQQRRSGGS